MIRSNLNIHLFSNKTGNRRFLSLFLLLLLTISCAEWSSEPNNLSEGEKIKIISPINGEIVSEGSINIFYNISQPYSLKFLELYVNGNFVKNIPPNTDGSLPAINYYFDSSQVDKLFHLYLILYDNNGNSFKSNTISNIRVVLDNRMPFKPYDVKLINFNNGTCNISWKDSSKYIQQYELWRKTGFDGEYILHQQLSGTFYNVNDTGLDTSKIYFYKIRGIKSSGISEFSSEVNTSGIYNSGSLFPATNLSLQVLSDLSIRINWRDNSDDENYFSVERSLDNNLFKSIAFLPPNSVEFTDPPGGLTLGTRYYYRIKNFSSTDSAVSTTANIVLNSGVLNPPSNLTAIYNSTVPVVELRWVNNDNRILFFDIERKTENSNFIPLKRINAGNNLYLDFSILTQQNYTYRIRGYDSIIYSDYSNEVTVSTF